MRIRNVKPEFYRSDDIDRLTWEQRFFFIALFSYVDDNGVGRDRLPDICADLFAGDFSVEPTETLGRVRQSLAVLESARLIVRYKVESKPYLFITGWDHHQYVKNPNKERYPRPDKALLQASPDSTETLGRESVDAGEALPTVVGSRSLVVGRTTPTAGEPGGNTRDLVAEWIDHCGARPPGQVIGQISKQIKQLLEDDQIPYDDVRRGLAKWQERGLHPSTLPSVVHEVRTAGPRKSYKQQADDDFFSDAMARAEAADAAAIVADRHQGELTA